MFTIAYDYWTCWNIIYISDVDLFLILQELYKALP